MELDGFGFGETTNEMDSGLKQAAREAIGFLPEDEGVALYEAAASVAADGPILEIGSYCGKSTIYLGAAAKEAGSVVYSIDHHAGSEEHQVGQEFFDERFFDPSTGRVDTFPTFRATIEAAELEPWVVPIVAASDVAARGWNTTLALVFLDGGHSHEAAHADLDCWAPHVKASGLLALHDVFEDPAGGGRPPFEIYERALASGDFEEIGRTGSLRVLKRIAQTSF